MGSFLWSVFFCIRTEHERLHSKFSYSVQLQEIGDQKKFRIWILSLCVQRRKINHQKIAEIIPFSENLLSRIIQKI